MFSVGLKRNQRVIFALMGGLVLTLLLHSFDLFSIEGILYDARIRFAATLDQYVSHQEPSPLALVRIDDETIDSVNEFAPLSLESHIELLKKIKAAQPKGIAYFIDFNRALELSTDPQKSLDVFFQLAEQAQDERIAILLSTEMDSSGEIVPPFPLSKLPYAVSILHKDGFSFARDKVVRKALFSVNDESTLHVASAAILAPEVKSHAPTQLFPEIDARYFHIHYPGQAFPEVTAKEVLKTEAAVNLLKDKIVLIGTQTQEDAEDYVLTPFSRTHADYPRLDVHAAIIDTLLNRSYLKQSPLIFNLVTAFFLTSLVIFFVFRTTPLLGMILTTGLISFWSLLNFLSFSFLHLWMELAHPLTGMITAYYIFIPYRLVMEYKKRWQLQEKNQVLMEVEELKQNFMNLITHDLKTPVARIQGMAELLQRSGVDFKIIQQILNSTEELNRFISSILELAKVESGSTHLNKQSKDINRLIEDCIKKFEFEFKARKISVKTDFEPLFPIYIDSHLITKVICNLIDNAIKYSPENSTITVETQESDEKEGFIEIAITDQGVGCSAQELQKLFSKFYRSPAEHNMKIKGTGLGLYLSKYFVEKHEGSIEAESIENKGSIFTIYLPNQTKGEQAYV